MLHVKQKEQICSQTPSVIQLHGGPTRTRTPDVNCPLPVSEIELVFPAHVPDNICAEFRMLVKEQSIICR